MVEEKIADLYPEEEIRCPVHLCIGQEAVAAGVCDALSRSDYVFSGHRSHGHYLAKGGDLKAMLAELYGKRTGCSGGKGGSMHLIDLSAGFLGSTPIVASTIPIAVGAALACQMRRQERVTAVFFGEAATEEGVFHESLNFAALKKLPVVFVCENNFYSVYSPLSVRRPRGINLCRLAEAGGVKSFGGDGNDVLEVRRLACKAVHRAREGSGPVFLEFKTYRWREHCGPGDDTDLGYRTRNELQEWRKKCPIEKLRRRMEREGLVSFGELEAMRAKIADEIEQVVSFAKTSPFSEPAELGEALCV